MQKGENVGTHSRYTQTGKPQKNSNKAINAESYCSLTNELTNFLKVQEQLLVVQFSSFSLLSTHHRYRHAYGLGSQTHQNHREPKRKNCLVMKTHRL